MIPLSLALYNILQAPALAGYVALSAFNSRRRPALPARFGRDLPEIDPGGLWVHALSLGETISARPLLMKLKEARPDLPIYLSAATTSGLGAARGEVSAGRAAAAFRAPFDFFPAVNRTLDRLRPSGLIIVETDIWPNLLLACRKRGIPTGLVNFRISEARDKGHRRLGSFFRATYGLFSTVALPTERDLERWESLGVKGVEAAVTGSLKFDQPLPDPVSREDLGLEYGRPVVIAGSTHPGEEVIILQAWNALRDAVPNTALILAPRNVERTPEVIELIRNQGIEPAFLSRGEGFDKSPILLVDLLGRLASLYRAAQAAFVGGSLVEKGGHNVLEPAALGVPVCFGPHMDNFQAESFLLLQAGAAKIIHDARSLANFWWSVMDYRRPKINRCADSARDAIFRHQGAAKRIVTQIHGAFGW